nr:CoA transferase [Salinisphaera hydrothermalis]
MPSKNTGPLEGIKVLDFTWSVAGPTMTRYLAGLGARVFKVEWPKGPDPMRSVMFRSDTQKRTWNNDAFFANLNIGKESLTINVKDPCGLDLIKDMIKHVDIVSESFSASVLQGWGLDYETMRQINPALVYISISGFGHTGPHKDKNTWGPTAQAMSGMTAASGVPGRDPAGWGYSYLDVSAGYMGAIGVLAAVRQAIKTGEGCHIDMSQVETGLVLVGPMLTDYLTDGKRTPSSYPNGNRSLDAKGQDAGYRGDTAPLSNIYPTAGGGKDDWVAMTVTQNGQWQKLCSLVADLQDYARLDVREITSRLCEIEGMLKKHFANRDKYTAADELTNAGIPAAPVQSGKDRVERDPQLKHRGLIAQADHPQLGKHGIQDLPYRFLDDGPDWQFTSIFPILGGNTRAILHDILGKDDAELEMLAQEDVFWPEGIPHEVHIEKSKW